MRLRDRVLIGLLAVLAMMFLVNCGGSYGCRVTFGSSTCTPSGSGIGGSSGGGGGGGGGGATAFAFAVDQGGALEGYTLNATAGTFQATPSYIAPTIPPNDPGVGMVVAQTQFVYAAFELENEIFGWSLNSSTGALTLLNGFPMPLSLDAPIVGFNQYNLATNPAGTLLFISNTGANEILVFHISSSGVLTPVIGSPFTTTVGAAAVPPGNLTTDGLGKYLYVSENATGTHTGSQVLAYSINSGTGALAVVPGSPFAFPMWQLQGDASGNYLIGTTGKVFFLSGSDDKNLYVFSILPSGANAGAISQVGSPFQTFNSPFNIAVQPVSSGGEFVYSFSINDTDTGYNPVEGFQLSATGATTGTLTTITGSPFSGIATGPWGQFDQSGANLFVYSSTASSGATVTQLAALSVSSTGVLTQPVSAATFVTPGYWVVTDP